jgi:hypothetical protein
VSGLDAVEQRILGCLLEKQRTTPDTYPLTLNALRLACNQSTNRDPVVDYDEDLIHETLQRMHRRELTRVASGHGSRSSKYRHLVNETLQLTDGEQALLCVLLLRGPQTPGELKTRTERLHPFENLDEVEATLGEMIDGGLAERLERRPGEKQVRYRHLLGDEEAAAPLDQADSSSNGAPLQQSPGEQSEIAALRERVERLEREVDELRSRLARG